MAPRIDSRKICCSILLLLYLLVLIGRVGAESETAYLSYYPSSYDLLRGRHVNGSFPSSIQITDSDYLILQSAPSDSFFSTGPSGYILRGLTSWISGNLSDLTSSNDVYMTFESYYSGIDTADSVDSTASDVDSSADKGTHGNFSAQQAGPDSIYDVLTETDVGAIDDWGITSSGFTSTSAYSNYRYMGGTSPNIDGMTVTKLHIRCETTGTVAIGLYTGGFLSDPTGATKRTEAYNVTVSSGWNEIDVPDYNWSASTVTWIGWCPSASVYYSMSSSDSGDFQSGQGRWSQTIPSDADETSLMPSTPGAGAFGNYWYAVYAEYTLPEYQMDLEVQWTNADCDETNEELAIYVDKGNNTHSLDATGGYMIIGDGTPDWGSTIGTISFWVQMDGFVQGRFWGQDGSMETRWSGTNLVLDWGGADSMTSAYSFSADTWYFVAIVWNENNDNLFLYIGDRNGPPTLDANSLNGTWTSTTPPPIQNRFLNGLGGNESVYGHGDDLRYWNVTRSQTEIQNDHNIELTGSEPNLRSYFRLNDDFDDVGPDNNDGSGSGLYLFSSEVSFEPLPTEDIQVDVWHNGSWQNLSLNLTEGWNNFSVSSYLDSSTFTIRFGGSEKIGDAVQDCWKIDVTLLNVWSNEQTVEVDFTGSSNLQNWSSVNWTSSIGWTTGSVSVTMQLYNFSQGAYSRSGSGYLSYNSSAIAEEDEMNSKIASSNLNHLRNATGHWKMKIRGVKAIDTHFELKVDWIQIRLLDDYAISTEFIFSEMTTDAVIRLNFTVAIQYSSSDVNVTVQVWDYSHSAYTADVEACLRYTSDGLSETKTLSIATDPQFYVSNGTSTIRIRGESPIPFRQETNQIELRYGYSTTYPLGQLLGWPGILLFAVPITIGLLFVPILISRRRKKSEPVFEDRVNPFSSSFGMTHKQMSGKKLLLEVDPTVDFQKALFSFVSEARINSDKVCIFTSKSSPLYSKFSGTKGIKFYLLTSKASSPRRKNAKETLLVAHDLSVLLNTIVKIHGTRRRKPVKIVFDNLSDTVLLCGFEKTYKFVRWTLETVSSPKMTILFVYNPAAHDPKTSSSIRGLFQTQLAYGKDGPKVGTL